MDENQVFGVITVIFCLIGYSLSWQYVLKEKFFAGILILLLCGLLQRIYVSTDFFLHLWDERFHALVSKNLIHHLLKPTLYENPVLPSPANSWTAGHIWLHKQPLPLWIMAISMKLFGVNEIALRTPSVVASTAGIGITYLTGKYFFNRKVAFVAAFLFFQ